MSTIEQFRSDASMSVMVARAAAVHVETAAKAFDERHGSRTADALASAGNTALGLSSSGRVRLALPNIQTLESQQIQHMLTQLDVLDGADNADGLSLAGLILQNIAGLAVEWNDDQTPLNLAPGVVPGQGNVQTAVLPTGERIALPLQRELDAAKGLFDDTPALSDAHSQAAAMGKEERLLQFQTDPRFAYMLLVISLLIRMVASQREQGAAMLQFAERSVQAMGQAMVDGAQERRTGAIIGLVTVAAIGAVGVGLGGVAAHRSISSIKSNQVAGAKMAGEANTRHLNGVKAKQLEGTRESQNQGIAQNNQKEQVQVELLQARHAKVMTQSGFIQQGGMAVGSASQSAGQIANAEYEVRAAEEQRIQETQRQNSETGRKINENIAQQSSKGDEQSKLSFELMRQVLQAEAEARDDITRKLA